MAQTQPTNTTPTTGTEKPDPWDPERAAETDEDLASLVYFADTDRAAAYKTNWKAIEKPLAPYRAVVEGVEP